MSAQDGHPGANAVPVALEGFERGQIAFAEAICRRLASVGHADATVWNLLGRIALAIGRPREAVDSFRRALAIDAYMKPAAKNLKQAAARLAAYVPPPPLDSPSYLLIRAWGQGFWSDVEHVLGALLLAEATGRTPIVHWGPESLYNPAPPRDAWREYLEPVNAHTIDEVVGRGFDYFPARWNERNLDEPHWAMLDATTDRPAALTLLTRRERVCVSNLNFGAVAVLPWLPEGHRLFGATPEVAGRDLFARYVRPRPDIAAIADEFAALAFAGKRVIAAHVRGTDKAIETDVARTIGGEVLDHVAAALNAGMTHVFLMTDSAATVAGFRAMFADRVLVPEALRTDLPIGIHMQRGHDKHRLGNEVVRDVLLAARCERFVGLGWSNVACAVRASKAWAPGACTLIGPVLQDSPVVTVHRPDLRWRPEQTASLPLA